MTLTVGVHRPSNTGDSRERSSSTCCRSLPLKSTTASVLLESMFSCNPCSWQCIVTCVASALRCSRCRPTALRKRRSGSRFGLAAAGDGTAAGGSGRPFRLREVVARASEGLETAGVCVPAKIGGTPFAHGTLAACCGSSRTNIQL